MKKSNNGADDDILSVDTTTASTAASPYWRPSYQFVDDEKTKGFSPVVAFCFAINYILGTGFLTIPWAFCQGGLLLSTVALVTMGVVSDVAKDYLLETMARAEAMLDSRLHWRTPKQLAASKSPYLAKIAQRAAATARGQALQASNTVLHANNNNNNKNATADEESDPLLMGRPPVTTVDYSTMAPKRTTSALSMSSSLPGSPNTSQHGGGSTTSAPRLRMGNTNNNNNNNKMMTTTATAYLVRDRKFEVNALCRVYLGKPALAVYSAFLCLYIYCSLWAYACVFCSALSKALPLIHLSSSSSSLSSLPLDNDDGTAQEEEAFLNYVMYAAVFASMVIPLSCLELDEQVAVQVAMTLCRFLMLFFMWTTCTTLVQDSAASDTFTPDTLDTTAAPWVRFAGLPQMLPICVFAHIFHHSIPGLSQPVARKRNLGKIFRATVVFATVAYALLGWRLGSVLGMATEQSANLNWKAYRGGVNVGEPVPWWAQLIAMYVVCFPALDVLSAFPLNAITLGNNLLGAVYGKDVHKAEENRWIRIQFRLLASFPPIVLAILVRELGTITDYAGTTGFVIGFSFPALLYLFSGRLAQKKNFATRTFYSSYGSRRIISWLIFTFGIAMVFYVVFFLIRGE